MIDTKKMTPIQLRVAGFAHTARQAEHKSVSRWAQVRIGIGIVGWVGTATLFFLLWLSK